MEALSIYLIKSVIWISGFALVFFLFLRNERFFFLKRLYLVSGILTALIFPFISVRYVADLPASESMQAGNAIMNGTEVLNPSGIPDAGVMLLALWLSGVLFVALKIILQGNSVLKTIKKSDIISTYPVKLIRTAGYGTSFSFFSWVVVNPSVTDIETKEIVNHEMAHIRQKHWLDLVLMELLCILQWFNPVAWIYLGFIRQNHEYLADEVALQRTSNPAIYRAALLNQIVGSPIVSLSNSFNYSLNKKRFNMMKNIISSPYRKMKVFLILPVFAIVLYAFAEPEYRYTSDDTGLLTSDPVPAVMTKEVKGTVVGEDGEPLPGAAIVIKGTTIGCLSDENGHFRLENIPEDGLLIISYIGFETKVMKPDFTNELTVKMVRRTIVTDTVSMPPPPPPPPPPIGAKEEVTSREVIGSAGIENAGDEQFTVVEEMPQFPGGEKAMLSWISGNLKYPGEAVKDKIFGLVYVSFTVSSTGKVKNVQVYKSAHPLLDAEAVRVISSMPDWKPGRQAGKAVDVEYKVPVEFKLQNL